MIFRRLRARSWFHADFEFLCRKKKRPRGPRMTRVARRSIKGNHPNSCGFTGKKPTELSRISVKLNDSIEKHGVTMFVVEL